MLPNLGATEIMLILLVVILLFGSKKLPDTARGLGRALRIFKAETKGLREDEDAHRASRADDAAGQATPPPPPSTQQPQVTRELPPSPPRAVTDAQPVKDAERSEH
jgi:sec-independent protein translocase protein TatA